MLKLIEIREDSPCYDPKIGKCSTTFSLREIYVNPNYIILARENVTLKEKSFQGALVDGLSPDMSFTEIMISTPGHISKTINVVGRTVDIIKDHEETR